MTQESVLSTVAPFVVEAKCPVWTSTLLARCDGRRTTREQLQFLKSSGLVPAEASEAEFAQLIRLLIDGGFLQLTAEE